MSKLAGYTYEYVPRESTRTLLLLHGTGGNERDMLSLGEKLDPSANLLSLRGNVSENGMLRFFRRHAEGVLDREDLAKRTEELADFIKAVQKEHGAQELVGIGYSNGANILLHLICLHPALLRAALLLRPMSAALPDSIGPLGGLPVCVGAGAQDELVPEGDAERIASVLKNAGATTTLHITPLGHRLGQQDVEAARAWLAERATTV